MKRIPNGHTTEKSANFDEEDAALLLNNGHDCPTITIQDLSVINPSEEVPKTSKSWFSDDESMIRKIVHKEETLYQQTQYPDQIELIFNIGIIYNILFLMTLIYQSIFCGLIINFYVMPGDNLRQLFIFLMIANLIKALLDIGIILFYNMLIAEYQRLIRMELMSSIGYVVIYMGVALYLSNQIEGKMLWLFCMPQLLLDFLYYCCFNRPVNLSESIMGKVKVLEAVQNLAILLNIGIIHYSNWTVVMCFYFFECFVLVVFSGIVTILVIVGITAWVLKFREMLPDKIIPIYLLSFAVYLGCIGFFAFFMFLAIIRLFNRGTLLHPSPDKTNLDDKLYQVAFSMLIFCVGIFFWNLIFGLLSISRIKRYVSYSTKQTKYYEYSTKLRLAAKLISDHFFKKASRVRGSESKRDRLLDKCFICFKNDANVMIFPCGHTGFCLDCLLVDQVKRNTCMICRKAVTKAKVLVYDPELQEYVAKGEVKFFETITNANEFMRD